MSTLSAMGAQLMSVLGAVALILAGPLIAVAFVSWDRWTLRRQRRSPLTMQMLRAPGESVREQLQAAMDSALTYLTYLMLLPSAAIAPIGSQTYLLGQRDTAGVAWPIGLIVTAAMVYCIYQCVVGMRKVRHLRLGLDGERAVGQELNELMRLGARVFHDFPAHQFNIDHVVIGPGGVYAVETKARSKPRGPKGKVKESVRVVYDGRCLKFPSWTETEPIDQAVRQARWLSEWLSSAVGWPVKVTPALAIPGWFVEHQAYEPVRVFSGRNPSFLVSTKRPNQSLNESQIRQIAHQVEQRCRTVKPEFLPADSQPDT